jgi:hypothetical protein
MINLGDDVPVSAQIDGDVDEETIATVLHFLKEMDENDDVAAAAVAADQRPAQDGPETDSRQVRSRPTRNRGKASNRHLIV